MNRELKLTPGVSARRSACDRCRGQKLRCLREGRDPNSCCDRCAKADAQCITSPIYRYCAPSYPTEDDAVSRKRRRPDNPDPGRSNSSSTSRAQSTQSAASEWPRAEIRFTETTVMDTFAGDFLHFTSGDSPDFTRRKSVIDAVPLPPPGMTPGPWAAGDLSPDQLFPNIEDFAGFGVDPHVPPNSTDPLQTSYQLDPAGPIQDSVRDQSMQDPGPAPEHVTRDSYMEQLSKINHVLVVQLNRVAKAPPDMNLKILISPSCETAIMSTTTPLEDILNITRQFLETLEAIARLYASTTSRVSNPSERHGFAHISTREHGSTPCTSSEDSQATSLPSVSSDICMSSAAAKPDSAARLLILMCYVHTLRLHVALFSHIHEFLLRISESEDRLIHPLPGLYGFSNFPLQSGNLQANMIIQLVTTMFERMEALLGLPRAIRIGTRQEDCGGLLADEGFLEIAQAIIRKEEEDFRYCPCSIVLEAVAGAMTLGPLVLVAARYLGRGALSLHNL
ncbi:uncharacterized protein JN550_009699 [Neoarthrinium moseri]|uniref:uncharacterized protein n=1 Tax=Neoarthrinium moseri TaxID=1658444 RepID=UPI001FDC43FA|nr:uncharacterized protein JN550_009699 [Neoarthrinium moseri]KAI1863173.1 hypothetical protein JN550_009699 [Neoarthrinium moseri]